MKNKFKPLYAPDKSGKEHSSRYDDDNKEFAKYLRTFFYNVMLSNYDIAEMKKNFENSTSKTI